MNRWHNGLFLHGFVAKFIVWGIFTIALIVGIYYGAEYWGKSAIPYEWWNRLCGEEIVRIK